MRIYFFTLPSDQRYEVLFVPSTPINLEEPDGACKIDPQGEQYIAIGYTTAGPTGRMSFAGGPAAKGGHPAYYAAYRNHKPFQVVSAEHVPADCLSAPIFSETGVFAQMGISVEDGQWAYADVPDDMEEQALEAAKEQASGRKAFQKKRKRKWDLIFLACLIVFALVAWLGS